MSPVAYLGNVFKPKGYGTCYICPGLVLQCEFNGNVCFTIRLTKYSNFSKYVSVYMFQAPFFKKNSTIDMCMMPIRSESNQIKHHKTDDLKCARVRSTLPKSVECMRSEDEEV